MKIYLDPAAGGVEGGGGAAGGSAAGGTVMGGPSSPNAGGDWRASLPDDLKSAPSLKDFKDVAGLAKSYVHAQSLIGAEKVLKPRPDWKPEQWGAFYDAVGRPATIDGYKFSEKAIPKDFTPEPAKLAAVQKLFHDNGLNNQQAEAVMSYYMKSIQEGTAAEKTTREQAHSLAMGKLKETYGENYIAKLDIAKAVVTKFGTPELMEALETTGIGNDPRFIELFIKMGEAMMDDSARGSGAGLLVTDATQARAEIESLKGDKEFIAALTNRDNPGHKAAVDKMTQLQHTANKGG